MGQTKGKNDIANGAAVLIGTKLYFAGDRLENEGDAQIGFWFFINGTGPDPLDGKKGTFSPPHAVGDILILSDFTGGGKHATVTVLEWVGAGAGNYPDDDHFNLIDTDADVAQNNDQVVDVPSSWSYKDVVYEERTFYEGYVDLAAVNISNLCFSSFLLETRSSQSITASTDDFIGGNFTTTPSVTTTNDSACYDPVGIDMQLCASSATATEFQWYNDAALTSPVANGDNACLSVLGVTGTDTFWVVVTNELGCTSNAIPAIVVIHDQPVCTIAEFENLTAYGSDDGSINLEVSGGTPGYTYSWTGPDGFTASTQDISNLAEGTYYVTITDANGCSTSCEQFIEWPPTAPSCTIEPTPVTCLGGSDGSASVAAGGGSGFYNYYWYNSNNLSVVLDSGASISGLMAGDYTVIVIDSVTDLESECFTTIEDGREVILTCPSDTLIESCISELELQSAFDAWLAKAILTGSDSMIYNDWDGTYPDKCGDTISVLFWTNDECAVPANCSSEFRVTGDNIDPVLADVPAGGDLGCNPEVLPSCDAGVTASDNCDGDISSDVVCTPGQVEGGDCDKSQTFMYTVMDECGNSDTAYVTYTWKVDVTDPVLADV
ncbi:SprB repeat-containing protein, partial [Maribellus sp. CM-23]|nr:SprB repeat-containing protein [Maribellus sp. CM-23]